MKPRELAARFAAFAWYMDNHQAPSQVKQAEAKSFSQNNWPIFLPVAHEGWGRLLLRVAKTRPSSQRRSPTGSRSTKRQLALAG